MNTKDTERFEETSQVRIPSYLEAGTNVPVDSKAAVVLTPSQNWAKATFCVVLLACLLAGLALLKVSGNVTDDTAVVKAVNDKLDAIDKGIEIINTTYGDTSKEVVTMKNEVGTLAKNMADSANNAKTLATAVNNQAAVVNNGLRNVQTELGGVKVAVGDFGKTVVAVQGHIERMNKKDVAAEPSRIRIVVNGEESSDDHLTN